jgi:hypothetical protein
LQNIALPEPAVPFMATLRAVKTLLPPLFHQRRLALFLATVPRQKRRQAQARLKLHPVLLAHRRILVLPKVASLIDSRIRG